MKWIQRVVVISFRFVNSPPERRCERILRPTFESGDVEEKMPTVLVVGINEKQTCFPNDAQHRTGPTMFLMSQNGTRPTLLLVRREGRGDVEGDPVFLRR